MKIANRLIAISAILFGIFFLTQAVTDIQFGFGTVLIYMGLLELTRTHNGNGKEKQP